MAKTGKGYTNVRKYDTYASYNADTERNDATISFVEQDNSVWVQGKQYSQNAECYVGSDVSGISTTGNWFLCGETTFGSYTDVNIIGSAVNTITGGMGGLFVLNLRSDQAQINPNYTFQWLCKVGLDAKTPVLRYVIDGMTIKLYCKVFGGQYNRIHIRIFNQVNRSTYAVHKEAFFTLKDSTTIIPEADVPSGTDIADVPYLLKTAMAAGSQKVLQTNATSSAERRVLLGENHETTQQDKVYKSSDLTFNPSTGTLTVPQVSGNAATATKLQTPRSFNLGGGLQGTAVNFDGTGNVELEGGLKKVFSTNRGKYNYQYHRFLSIGSAETPLPAAAQNYHFTFLVQSSETAEGEGILDINLRTNGSTQNSYLDCKWLLLSSNSSVVQPKIAYGFSNNATTTYADLFIEHTEAYKYYHFVLLSFNVRASLNVTSGTIYTLYNSSEVGNTTATDKDISYEVYASIAQAGQEIHGHTTDAGYSIVKDDTILDNVATFVSGFVNHAKTVTKLQNARKIGFANFDGSANVSLNTIHGAFYARWTTDTTQWLRIIRFKTKTTYTRKQLILAVYDIEGSSFSGIVEVTLATGFQLTTTYAFVNWLSLWAAPNYNYKGMFKITATYPTDNDEYVYLDVYANSPYTYKTINFCVLSCNAPSELTIGNSGERVEGSALQNVVHQSTTDTSLVPKQSLFATDSAFLRSLEGLCHKSQDSSLDLRRRTEYICGQQVLSDTEEAGKAFYGSSANPLVISVPLKDPGNSVAGDKVNVNIIRFYYADTYWQELFFCVNSPNIYTRWVASGNARPWYRMMKEDSIIEYDAWVTKATNATNADVANKTKYPLIVASGNTQFNWSADSTLKLTIPEEMLASAANGVFVMKVPEIEKAKRVTNNDLSNKTELTLPAIHSVTDGMSLGQSPIKLNVGENSLNVNISGKSATSGTADVANKTKYPLILRQDDTNVVSWFADSTVILDVPSEMIKNATSGGITLARANRTFVATATGGSLFTDETGGRIITLQNYATFDITPIEGDILILRVVNSIQAQGMYPLVIPYTSANTVAKSIALVRGQNPSGWINWTTSQLSAGIYQFACINNGTSLRWALISNNTFNAP